MDKDLRELERSAFDGNDAAIGRLRRARCRAGQCCGHWYDIPTPSEEALGCMAHIEEMTIETLPGFQAPAVANIRIIIQGDNNQAVTELLEWLQKLAPRAFDLSMAKVRVRTIGGTIYEE